MESGMAEVKIDEQDLSKEPWEGKKIILCLYSVLTQLLIAHKITLPEAEQAVVEADDFNALRGLFLGVITRLNETREQQNASITLLASKCKDYIDDGYEKQIKIIALEKELVKTRKDAHGWRRVAVIGIVTSAVSLGLVLRP